MTDIVISPGYERLRAVTPNDIVAKACAAAFGKPLVTNILRSMLVEAIVSEALSPDWRWVSADWAGWDFENASGTTLEVKQSAARQSWATELSLPSKGSFDIALRTGHWVGSDWVAGRRRYANIYVLAHHPIADVSADHRDPQQWRFYVVSEALLPAEGKTISLSAVLRLRPAIPATTFEGLAERVGRVTRELPLNRDSVKVPR